MSCRRVGPALIFVLLLAGRIAYSQTPPISAVTYTEGQATRGNQVFGTVCLDCHARKDLSNADFRAKWGGRTAFDFFEQIRSTMPESSPGSLERTAYLDVTAYMMQLNGLVAGTTALPEDEANLRKQLLTFAK